MKTNLITIAAMLTMLLALGGCKFGSNGNDNADQPNPNAQLDCQLNQYLFHQPVEQVAGNTLGSTPADIQNLVSGFDIDIRNSVYSILQQVNNEAYTYGEGKERDLYFSMGSIIQPIMGDAGVSNAMAKDYNECIRSIGVERLNQGEGRQCGEQWGRSWKAQVIDKLLASPSLQNSLYDWVKPELQRVFNGFNSDQRTLMIMP